MAQHIGQVDLEEEDDFGGFEAAEPFAPIVAHAVDVEEASPNPWAIFPPTVPVQPDLLCSQNYFPRHLDTPNTVDITSSAAASLGASGYNSDNQETQEDEFDLERDLHNSSELEQDANLANDILDGSFRSALSSQSGASFVPHVQDGSIPIVAGLDLDPGIGAGQQRADNSMQQNFAQENLFFDGPSANENFNAAAEEASTASNCSSSQQYDGSKQGAMDIRGHDLSHELGQRSSEMGQRSNETEDSSACVIGSDSNNERTLLQNAVEEKLSVQKELENLLAENRHLSEHLKEVQTMKEQAQTKLEEIQVAHKKQLGELRQAGHEALAVVVEEYKELMKVTVLQQQEMCEERLRERLREETQRFQEVLEEQKEKFQMLLRENQVSQEEKIQESISEQCEKEKEGFEKFLTNERQKSEDKLENAIQEEKASLAKQIEQIVKEERIKAEEELEKAKVEFNKQLQEEREKSREQVKEALREERKQSQALLNAMLEEERKSSREQIKQAVEATREEMKTYFEELRKADKNLHRRQLASLDIFLESARHQLNMLMSDSTDKVEDSKS
ncbi:hypothetical protein CHS0354_028791 [Potamilus streckersoni]|uniref:Coiled-coil domain-containing protein 91 n=1 Tax=Potamilus streckersoni TaxID=2493646 RepID=A0AAE0S9Q8_9BIVA|nr:hypothetical protein CHS0354_028791 [Potamilus streckersoni]